MAESVEDDIFWLPPIRVGSTSVCLTTAAAFEAAKAYQDPLQIPNTLPEPATATEPSQPTDHQDTHGPEPAPRQMVTRSQQAAIDRHRAAIAQAKYLEELKARSIHARRVPWWDPYASDTIRDKRVLRKRFCDDTPMDLSKPPSFKINDFRVPCLRKCTFDLDTIDWRRTRRLGSGADGTVYRVRFRSKDDKGPFYVLKLFWDASPSARVMGYFGAQRECQNAALLQMIQASIDQANAVAAAAGGQPAPSESAAPAESAGPTTPAVVAASPVPTAPPLALPNPVAHYEALINYFAFSEEVRLHRHETHEDPPDIEPVVAMPRFAKCYGWLRVPFHELEERMPGRLRPYPVRISRKISRQMQEGRKEYFAVVYEYIEDEDDADDDSDEEGPRNRPYHYPYFRSRPKTAKNDPEKVAAVAKFLFRAGFSFCSQSLARNWKNGVLVDHSDIIAPRGYGWFGSFYRLRTTEELLAE